MASKQIRFSLILLIVLGLSCLGYIRAGATAQVLQTGTIYDQPVDPAGKLILSSWREPDGSDFDQYVWEDFTIPAGGTITGMQWYGGYDPLKSGKGGPVADFTVSIYPSIPAGTEPAVANPPLVKYHTGGSAGETAFDVINGVQINVYSFNLPTPFAAAAGVKYWVQVEASQQGSTPDWCFISGTGGSGNHYIRTSGAGGDVLYRFAPGDIAFVLSGSTAVPITPTPAMILTPSRTPVAPPTEPPTSTPVPPQIPTCLGSIFTFMMLMIFISEFRITKA